MKQCSRCREWHSFDAFARRKRSKDGLQHYCRACQHAFYTAYYASNGSALQEMLRRRRLHQRTINRRFVANYLRNHPCVDCGQSDPIVLEFDHIRGTKVASIGAMVCAPVALKTLEQEIAKCAVRCANCHRRRTSRNWRYASRTRIGEEIARFPSYSPQLLYGDCSSAG